MRKRLIAVVGLLCFATSLLSAQGIQIQAVPTQGALAGDNFVLPLSATGGVPPYTWQLISGTLPPGLKLNSHSGKVSGIPATPGEYRFTVSVADSNIPQSQTQRDFVIQVIAGLSLEWKVPPAVHGSSISGSAIVSNQTGHDMVLTVIVVAVNQIGRATALGYQHFTVSAGTKSPVIPFAASPGLGTYFVRADAAAHQVGHRHVYRASKQSDASLVLAQF